MAFNMADTYDIGLAWNWEFDHYFIHGIETECQKIGLSTFRVDPENIAEVTKKVRGEKLFFSTFLDRASDADEEFIPLAKLLGKEKTHIFNRFELTEYAKDKSNMHLALLGEGVDIPYTIIVTPYNKKKEIELSLSELHHLGRPFIIKPANTTGGGTGVVLGAETLKEILESRQHHKNDTYLLQETVQPRLIDHHKAWFRVFYAFGTAISCWWDPVTHVYELLSTDQEKSFKLKKLREIVLKMHSITRLEFFSTEIAFTDEGKFVAVDYINEICDMREQSRHFDGVPDEVIKLIQTKLAGTVKVICKKLS
jgi:hypothetical protein